jgi:hypothetical protein
MKYRKKPVIIEAVQLTGAMLGKTEALPEEVFIPNESNKFAVKTLEGVMKANVGDYAIIGVRGEHYFCQKDIFEETYEEVK